jgi:hypothetical protein
VHFNNIFIMIELKIKSKSVVMLGAFLQDSAFRSTSRSLSLISSQEVQRDLEEAALPGTVRALEAAECRTPS